MWNDLLLLLYSGLSALGIACCPLRSKLFVNDSLSGFSLCDYRCMWVTSGMVGDDKHNEPT